MLTQSGIPLWKYITLIETVQRKYTKHITGIKDLISEERLTKLNLLSLQYRRFRGDHIQVLFTDFRSILLNVSEKG